MSKTKIFTIVALGAAMAEAIKKSTDGKVEVVTLESFKADLEKLEELFVEKTALEAKDLLIKTLKENHTTVITELQSKFDADLTAKENQNTLLTSSLEKLRTESDGVIKDLKVKLKDALNVKASKSDKRIVEVDGVKYIVVHGAAPYSAAELSANEDAAREVLTIEGQQALVKL